MRDLVRRAPVAMLIESGPDHRCEMVNDRFTALLGYTVGRHSRCHHLGLVSILETGRPHHRQLYGSRGGLDGCTAEKQGRCREGQSAVAVTIGLQ